MADDLPRLLAELYAAEAAAVRDRPEADLARPTRTDWTVRELLFHQLLDAQRTLVALATPADTTHLLDLTVDLAGAPGPSPAALAETRRVLEALQGQAHEGPLPARWDDVQTVLKGTGREAPTAEDRAELGEGWRPLLG